MATYSANAKCQRVLVLAPYACFNLLSEHEPTNSKTRCGSNTCRWRLRPWPCKHHGLTIVTDRLTDRQTTLLRL